MVIRAVTPPEKQRIYDKAGYSGATIENGFIFVSGQVGVDSKGRVVEDPEAQFMQAFENLKTVLNTCGAGLEDIVELMTFHIDLRKNMELVMAVKDKYMQPPNPAWTGVGVVELGMEGLLLEIRATAKVAD